MSSPPLEPPTMPSCLRRGQAAPRQILGDRRKIVIGALPVLLDRRLVPGRAELAAAADVGERPDIALLEPQPAAQPRIPRHLRALEAAIAVEQRRRRTGLVLPPHDEIRNHGAVLRCRLELLGGIGRGIETRRLGFDGLKRRCIVVRPDQRGRRQEIGVAERDRGAVHIGVVDGDVAIVGKCDPLRLPFAADALEGDDAATHIVDQRDVELGPGPRRRQHGRTWRRFEQRIDGSDAAALQPVLEVERIDAAGGVGLAVRSLPRAAQREHQLAVEMLVDDRVERQRHLPHVAIRQPHERLPNCRSRSSGQGPGR